MIVFFGFELWIAQYNAKGQMGHFQKKRKKRDEIFQINLVQFDCFKRLTKSRNSIKKLKDTFQGLPSNVLIVLIHELK